MMSEEFGARLRRQREQQEIALTTIAEQTKISLPLLEALERGDVSHWPGGIFRRAFLRAYAHAIGLEPDGVVREFLEIHPDPVEAIAPPSPRGGLLSRLGLRAGRKAEPVAEVPPAPAEPISPKTEAPLQIGTPAQTEAPVQPDLLAVARLCTDLSRVEEVREAAPLLREAIRILDAVGLIVWVWDPQAARLRAALGSGYSDRVLAQLPGLDRDTDNATAAAFRSARPCVVNGSDRSSGALAVPLIAAAGPVGVLAIELQHGQEQSDSTRAVATILAAQVVRWIDTAQPEEAPDAPAQEPDAHAPRPAVMFAS